MTIRPPLDPEERRLLLALAREAVARSVTGAPLPEIEACKVPPRLAEPAGCFVTLTREGALRGCIGNLEPRWPLWQAVLENARAAATRDRRFPPVGPDELETLRIEISVLTPPQPLACDSPDALLARLVPGRDGVLLELGTRRATFLPQVWDKLPDKVSFLDQLALKAGGAAGDWRRPDARVSVYTVEHFEEADDPGATPDPPSLEPGPDPDYAAAMDMATVFRTFNSVEAQLIRGRLETAGIPVNVRNEQSVLGGGAGIAGVEYCVDVPEASAEEARELLRAPARPE